MVFERVLLRTHLRIVFVLLDSFFFIEPSLKKCRELQCSALIRYALEEGTKKHSVSGCNLQ